KQGTAPLLSPHHSGLGGRRSEKQIPFIKRDLIKEEKKRGGRLPSFTYLTQRVRYSTRGGVISSREFVDQIFEQNRQMWRFWLVTPKFENKGFNKTQHI
ncbi:MAG: hypothetical protein ACR2RV_10410, partial [Verrucomicrobiales bacterium]